MPRPFWSRELARVAALRDANELDAAEVQLKRLSEFRPLPLKYFNEKAAILHAQGRTAEAYTATNGYFNFSQIGEEERRAFRDKEAYAAALNNTVGEAQWGYLAEMFDPARTTAPELEAEVNAAVIMARETQQPNAVRRYMYACYETVRRIEAYFSFWIWCRRISIDARTHWMHDAMTEIENMQLICKGLDAGDAFLFIVAEDEQMQDVHCRLLAELVEAEGNAVKLVTPSQAADALQALGGFAWLIARETILDELYTRPELRRRVQKLVNHMGPAFANRLTAGYAGAYVGYISRVYGAPMLPLLHRPPECAVSIVIPTRNAAGVLRHTLRTCTDAPDEDIEILVSDNSTPGNRETEDLVRELDDPRIRYLHTPRPLFLNRSFEYAMLNAKGAFVLSVGSDDGLLVNGLRHLKEALAECPHDEILQWDRLYYHWPHVSGIQEGLLICPEAYGAPKLQRLSGTAGLRDVLQNPARMYALPTLYVNSGCRRDYMRHMIERTNRLWDGPSQDIYMGVFNACMYEDYPYLRYPLTVMGFSSNSYGANQERMVDLEEQLRIRREEELSMNQGAWVQDPYEMFAPNNRVDASNLYRCYLRMVGAGLTPVPPNEVDWKQAFLSMVQPMRKTDMQYGAQMASVQYAAAMHGSDFLNWLTPILEQHGRVEKILGVPDFYERRTEGMQPDGSIVVDGMTAGVENVYDAVQLIHKQFGF